MAISQTFQLIKDDPWLSPYQSDIVSRNERYSDRLKQIKSNFGSLTAYAQRDFFLGFHYSDDKKGWFYREWAPSAQALFLIGDFNEWNTASHPLELKEGGVWELFIADIEGKPVLEHKSLVKVHVVSASGSEDKIPAYIKRVVQDETTHAFSGQIWAPAKAFKWKKKKFVPAQTPLIYECHIGMAQEKEAMGTYKEFEEHVLPRVISLGYNTIQVMAIMEHPYYGSFGYHVSNFFASSSKFGTPADLKSLVQKAHDSGIAVIMDIVHSHAVKNTAEGLNEFDGSDDQYFHTGGRGNHDQWDSKLFNYSKEEVERFLLSNIRFWMEEYRFDGFRFDGVTSMLYFHHGNTSFDHYDKYFKDGVDWDAITYLQLATTLMSEVNTNAIAIAEDMSGMPGLCRPIEEGGVGFDYRLAMGIPDYWIKLLKHKSDEDWDVEDIYQTLINRRYKENTIAYVESHDQALVGDKTNAFWLMDKEMYWHMAKSDDNFVIDRGVALHKIIRGLTASLGGEGYMTFMGNEFGHPEWVDFPREGNNWSFKHCRRQWSLVDNEALKYEFLNNWDSALIHTLKQYDVLDALGQELLNVDHQNQTIVYRRGDLIFVVNIHHSSSVADYQFYVPEKGDYKVVLSSDDAQFGGHSRVDNTVVFSTIKKDATNFLSVYNVSRSFVVYKKL